MAARKRQSAKLDAVTGAMRSRIVTNRWAPGSRIPPRSVLVDELSVSSATLQLAVDALVGEGFVETFGSNGTRVAVRPPHLFSYGLVFPDNPGRSQSRIGLVSRCIELVPEIERSRGGLRMPIFFGDDGISGSPRLKELLDAVEKRSLAGLIFVNNPLVFANTPILDQPGLPRVAISAGKHPLMPVVGFDYRAWITRLASSLEDAGCRRVAVLGAEKLMRDADHYRFAMSEFAERGLRCGPHWWQSVSLRACESAGNVVRLLMHASQNERPDAIVIEDDHLLDPVIRALDEMGVSVPGEVAIFSHCNLPRPDSVGVNVNWLGFPVQRALSMCLDSLNAQIRGEKVRPFTAVPPVVVNDAVLPERS